MREIKDRVGIYRRRVGRGYLQALEGCVGCSAVVRWGDACGLGEKHCVVAWAFEHLKEIRAQVPKTRDGYLVVEQKPPDGGTTNVEREGPLPDGGTTNVEREEAPPHEGTTNMEQKHE